MKPTQSQFNYFADYEDSVICLNGISNQMIVFKKNEYNTIFNNLILEESFPENYPTLYQKFIEFDFLIKQDKNEIEYIKAQNNKRIFCDTNYWLTINPTIDCNFNCWYCIVEDSNLSNKKIRMPDNVVKNVQKYITKLIESNTISGIHLDWFGGEPLLFFNEVVYPISKFALSEVEKANRTFINHATTNAYLIDEKKIKQFNEIKLNSFQITLDGDEDKHNNVRNDNGKPSFRKIIENIKAICNSVIDARITLRINYDKITLLKIDTILSEFSQEQKEKITINFQRVWQVGRVTDDENELLKKCISDCVSNGFNVSHFGYKPGKFYACYADRYNHAAINFDGKFYKCTARDYNEKNTIGTLKDNGDVDWIDEKIYTRFASSHFENEHCLKCNLLPLCSGPCSQKVVEFKNGEHKFDDICTMKNSEINLNSYLISEARNRKLLS